MHPRTLPLLFASIEVALCVAVPPFGCSAAKEAPVVVKEVDNPTYAIRDRCVSCHASEEQGADHPGPSPDRFHPAAFLAKHPVTEMGCAVCHGGEPLATEKEIAHGQGSGGNKLLLTGLQTQSRCVRCHEEGDVAGTEFLQKGLALIDDRACFACHEIPGGDPRARKAPRLENIANKVHTDWLTAWLMDPAAYAANTRMPSFELSEPDARAITSYLASLAEPASEPVVVPVTESLDRAEARRLLKQSACLDCHRIRGVGGNAPGVRAPDLSRIGDKVKTEWIAQWLKGPQHLQPGAGMPAFRFSDEQALLIARYLTSTFRSKPLDAQAPEQPPSSDPKQIEAGKWLVAGLGCMNCHGDPADTTIAKIGPDLRQVGDRDVRGVYWPGMGKDWNMRLSSYLRTKVSRPRAFAKEHRMPNFRFTPEETEAIVVALLSFSANPIPEAARIHPSQAVIALWSPSGPAAAVFDRYQCLQCHALRGAFGKLAPDLGWEGDRVHREWLIGFLKNPMMIRPSLAARMPNFGMTDDEVRLVADYIEANWWDEKVPPDPFEGKPPLPELIAQGKSLFESDYACLDCHTVADKGEEDGPDLSAVGKRLQSGWLYQWVIDPQRFVKSEMDPQGVTEQDALAITAYLITLQGEASP